MNQQTITTETLERSFSGSIPGIKVSLGYQLALLLVTLVMILLPILYIGIILLAGYGVYYYAIYGGSFVLELKGWFLKLIVYGAPIVSGVVMILFMIKPFFAKFSNESSKKELTRDEEPVLFSFIEMICNAVGAPNPQKVMLDYQANASASFSNGFFSFFTNNLTLTIGIPLISHMSITQLGGILAHEFGHFAQGTAMRLNYIIYTVNMWFYKAIYLRDSWDERLERWSKEADFRIAAILWTARGSLWATRKILWLLMKIGHMVSSFMSRQMEYDADRYEINFGGTQNFEQTTAELVAVSSIWNQISNSFNQDWINQELAHNIPALVQANMGYLDDASYKQVQEIINGSSTKLFDTHPCDKDRIASAQKENKSGIFKLDEPSTRLFSNFEGLSIQTSAEFYQYIFEDNYRENYLTDTQTYVQNRYDAHHVQEALQSFFHKSLYYYLPVSYTYEKSNTHSIDEALETINSIREKLSGEEAETDILLTRYDKVLARLSSLKEAETLLNGKLTFDPFDFDLKTAEIDEVLAEQEKAKQEEANVHEEYRFIHDQIVQVIRSVEYIMRLDDYNTDYFNEHTSTLKVLFDLKDDIKEIYIERNSVLSIYANIDVFEQTEDRKSYMGDVCNTYFKLIEAFKTKISGVPYYFDQESGKTIDKILIPNDYNYKEPLSLLHASQQLLNAYESLYKKTMGGIASIALQIEQERVAEEAQND